VKLIEPAGGGDHKSKGRAPASLIGRKAETVDTGFMSLHQLKQAIRPLDRTKFAQLPAGIAVFEHGDQD
jgi:hypothetical protein